VGLRRIRTASVATLGCKLNQSESDQMARQLADAGVTLVPFGEPADLCVVNSCTVTHVGDRKSRQLIRQAARAGESPFVVVTGCYAEVEPDTVRAMQGVGLVLGNRGKEKLVDVLREHGLELGGGQALPTVMQDEAVGLCLAAKGGSGFSHREREEGISRTRAFVKIQDGCDNCCSYCIVPKARGHQRSLAPDRIVSEIQELEAAGCREVVLTGVNISAYGRDYASSSSEDSVKGQGLVGLLELILAETKVVRIRLSSLQPEDWNPGFYRLWDSGRMCRHLHLSLQSGSDSVLRRMRRRYNVDQYARIVAEAKRRLPGVAITTDVIVGFPGETESEQTETERFLKSLGLAGLHVFKYSPRAGTPAAEMDGQVDPRTKQERSERLLELGKAISRSFRTQFVGSTLQVLWEESLSPVDVCRLGLEVPERPAALWSGLSDNYIRVYAASSAPLTGVVSRARVERLAADGVIASPIDLPTETEQGW